MITREIGSLQHPIVKHWVKLRKERSYRKESKRVLLMGAKLIRDLSSLIPFRTLILDNETPLPPGLSSGEVYKVSFEILKKITGLEAPEPLAAEVDLPPPADLNRKKYLIALDGISDPGNLGTLLRTALALGWEGVYITEDSTDPFNDKALRAAKGATFRLPLTIGSREELEKLITHNRMQAYVADVGGKPFEKCPFAPPVVLVLGNESHGVSPEMKKKYPAIAIPILEMESLNVASAGAILMYQIRRS